MAAEARDARRRRRILEQGSDRLAFIAGRAQNLPLPLPDPPSSSSSSNPNTALPPTVQDSDSTLLNPQPYNNSDSSNNIIQTPPWQIESEISSSQVEPEPEPEPEPAPEPESEPEPEPEPEPEHVQIQPPQAEESKLSIIPSDITCAINASKVTRLCCSVVMALLVIASYLGFSLFGSKLVKTVIGFRPLYLVLVTNLTVVVARLVSGKQNGFERRRRRRNTTSSSDGDGDKWDAQLARTFELGLLVKNVMDAVFMDCAVYAIVLICGLSFLHK